MGLCADAEGKTKLAAENSDEIDPGCCLDFPTYPQQGSIEHWKHLLMQWHSSRGPTVKE